MENIDENEGVIGDPIFDYLLNQKKESVFLDFKRTIDIQDKSHYLKIIKDVLAFANSGGGYLLIGVDENKSSKVPGRFTKIGVTNEFQFDDASFQEKINSYIDDPITIHYAFFKRDLNNLEKQFALIYIPPSHKILKPLKDGKYSINDKEKFAFRKNIVYVRRGTQSIIASSYEIKDMETRINDSNYRLSILNGVADKITETLYSNLLKIKKTPNAVYIGKIKYNTKSKLDNILQKRNINLDLKCILQDKKIITFENLNNLDSTLSEIVCEDEIEMELTRDWLKDNDKSKIIQSLLNKKIIDIAHDRKINYDKQTKKIFYGILDDKDNRDETWSTRHGSSSKKIVAHKIDDGNLPIHYIHDALSARIIKINDVLYLKLNPTKLVTSDKKNPIHDMKYGPTITKETYRIYNQQYLNNLLFWIYKLGNGGEIKIDDLVISNIPVKTKINRGIKYDTPVSDFKKNIEEFDLNNGDDTMAEDFIATYIEEPDLIFGNQGKDKDPRTGLSQHGPFLYDSETAPLASIRLGIIGDKSTTALTEKFIQLLKNNVKSKKPNKWLYADYPGVKKDSNFKCTLEIAPNWNASLYGDTELKKIKNIVNVNKRIAYAVDLYEKKLEKIASNDDKPDVIICTLPKLVEEYCGIGKNTYGAKNVKFTVLEQKVIKNKKNNQSLLAPLDETIISDPEKIMYDFRRSLKGKAMKIEIPIQIIKESTLNEIVDYENILHHTKEDPSTLCWNFSTALYYKANGKPWRLAKLKQNTCYVGISFFVNKKILNREIHSSMAQIFTHDGSGLILRGTEVDNHYRTKQPYLKKEQAEELIKKILEKYKTASGRMPTRVVIHKSSYFTKEEREGFNTIYDLGITEKDFVTIQSNTSWINFIRTGQYPVLRGTMIQLNTNQFLLYATGYTPRIRTYAGHRIPNALSITHIGDSSNEIVSKEILELTKLDWNTTSFAISTPITITFAKKVGDILSELYDDSNIKEHYKYFM